MGFFFILMGEKRLCDFLYDGIPLKDLPPFRSKQDINSGREKVYTLYELPQLSKKELEKIVSSPLCEEELRGMLGGRMLRVIPADASTNYRFDVEKFMEGIESNRSIGLLLWQQIYDVEANSSAQAG